MAYYGLLDGSCITSIGRAYTEFIIELYKLMGRYKNKKSIKEDYKWLRNIK